MVQTGDKGRRDARAEVEDTPRGRATTDMPIVQEAAVEQHVAASCVPTVLKALFFTDSCTDSYETLRARCMRVICTDTLVTPAKQCIICDVKLGDKDVIELMREGTICS